MPSSHLILCLPLFSCPQTLPASGFFSNESALHIRWPKYWSFSLSISPSNEYSGPISFRMDWFDLLVVQRTLKSFPTPQFKSINSLALSLLFSMLTCISFHTDGSKMVCVSLAFISQLLKSGSIFILFFKCSRRLFVVVHRLFSSSRARVLECWGTVVWQTASLVEG